MPNRLMNNLGLWLPELLTQAIQRSLLTPDAKERAFFVGAFPQHFAAREYFTSQLLGGPGRNSSASTRSFWKNEGSFVLNLDRPMNGIQ